MFRIAYLHAPSPHYLLDLDSILRVAQGASTDELYHHGATSASLIEHLLRQFGDLHTMVHFEDWPHEEMPDVLVIDLTIMTDHHYRALDWAAVHDKCKVILLGPPGCEIGFDLVTTVHVERHGLHYYRTPAELKRIFRDAIRLRLVRSLPR